MISRKYLLFAFAICAAGEAAAITNDCPAGLPPIEEGQLEDIEFNREHSRTLQSTVVMLRKQHYEDIAIDDEFSSLWLDEYLDFLDPTKSYLTSEDVEQFKSSYGDQLDDFAARGDLDAAEEIYELYRDRAVTQLQTLLDILENPEWTFDYSSDDVLPTDRDDYQWPADVDEAERKAIQRLTLLMLNLKLADRTEEESREQLTRRYHSQLASLKQQTTQQVLDMYLNALGHVYDPHTDYFSPRDSENFEINMSLSLEGIGAVLQKEDEYTKVVSVVPGGPADKQGQLKAADRIVAIGEGQDCEFIDIVGWRLDEVVDRIRGAKGTSVRLKVIPADEDRLSEEYTVIPIVRDKVALEDNAAKGEMIEVESQGQTFNLGVIDIPSFYLDINGMRNRDPEYRSTTRDVKDILDNFMAQGVDGVIIDLRQNGGGSLLEAATLTDLFVDPGPVVQIRDQNDRIYRNHRARSSAYYTGPMMVLIDRLSASASEIFAGAIQDYGRGLIVGSQSFGKGTVQSVQSLPSGQLKLTESKFYRISGDSTQHKGVLPDIELPSLFNPTDIGESSYLNALGWDQIRGIPHRRYDDYREFIDELMQSHKQRMQTNADMQYLVGTIALAEERRSQKTVSLNEQARIAERERWDQLEDTLLEKWRLANNIEVPFDNTGGDELASASEDEAAEEPETVSMPKAANDSELADSGQEAPEGDSQEASEEQQPDIAEALLRETGRIFADLLRLTRQEQGSDVASVKNNS
jgi:carboxyl-terminal processing protease